MNVDEALKKFAVSGQMYARALGNTAARTGGRVAPQVLNQVAAQPRAAASPFLGQQARMPGAIPAPNPGLSQVTNQYQFAHPDRLPHDFHDPSGTMDPRMLASVEKAHAAQQAQHFDQALQNTGRAYHQPGGTAALNTQLRQQFGSTPHDLFYDVINQSKNPAAAHAPTQPGVPPHAPTMPGAGGAATSIGRRRPALAPKLATALEQGMRDALAAYGLSAQ